MTDYRRHFQAGGTFFFTVTLADRRNRLLTEHIDRLREAVRQVRARHPVHIDAWVVLPEHLHAIWTLPAGDHDYPLRWRLMKTEFSRALPMTEPRSLSRLNKNERGIWQRRYWEHCIRDNEDFRRHMDYVHFNPVKHGHVAQVADWPYSTFHGEVRNGRYPRDWAGSDEVTDGFRGEWE